MVNGGIQTEFKTWCLNVWKGARQCQSRGRWHVSKQNFQIFQRFEESCRRSKQMGKCYALWQDLRKLRWMNCKKNPPTCFFSGKLWGGLINAVNYAKQRRKMWMGHWFQPLEAPRRSEKYCWQSLQPWTQHKSWWSVPSFHWRWHVKCTWPHRPVWLRKTCGCFFTHEAQPQAVDRPVVMNMLD